MPARGVVRVDHSRKRRIGKRAVHVRKPIVAGDELARAVAVEILELTRTAVACRQREHGFHVFTDGIHAARIAAVRPARPRRDDEIGKAVAIDVRSAQIAQGVGRWCPGSAERDQTTGTLVDDREAVTHAGTGLISGRRRVDPALNGEEAHGPFIVQPVAFLRDVARRLRERRSRTQHECGNHQPSAHRGVRPFLHRTWTMTRRTLACRGV